MTGFQPKPFVFVLMPFDRAFDDVYEMGIKTACTRAGAYAERVDEQVFEGSILQRIYNQIAKADIVVADMSGRNHNVFYETGYAHALGKSVILLTKCDDDILFDLKHHPHIIYQDRIVDLLPVETAAARRVVPLAPSLIRELKAWKLRCPYSQLDLVFPTRTGAPQTHANTINRGLRPALRRAGLHEIRLHDLRHSYASMLIANGTNLKLLQSLLGHSSAAVHAWCLRPPATKRGRGDRGATRRIYSTKW